MLALFKRLFLRTIDYSVIDEILPVLESGNKEGLQKYLWQPQNKVVDYLPFTYGGFEKFAIPPDFSGKLSVYKVLYERGLALVIFDLPWVTEKNHFAPVIVHLKQRKILGAMLPFNEIMPLLSNKDRKIAMGFGTVWVTFIISSGLLPGV
jgi:hypothetical protein